MWPTFNPVGDFILVRHCVHQYQVGDVVVATSPTDPNLDVAKRIHGMAGTWANAYAAF